MPKRLILAALLSQALFAHAAESDDVVQRARAMIEEGRQLREAAELRFREAEVACYDTFFVNHCLDRARKARTAEIRQARALETGGKRMELEERRRIVSERGSSIDMSPGRDAPSPTPVGEAGKQDSAARISQPETGRGDVIVRPVPGPEEAQTQRMSTEDAARLRAERERTAQEAEERARREAALERLRREREAPPMPLEPPPDPTSGIGTGS
jgi:colicin import membrane protein